MLLDTCTFLWLVANQNRLSATATNLIRAHATSLLISSISAFEIAVKHRKGALTLPVAPREWFPAALRQHGVTEVLLDSATALQACELPMLHSDPCDRIIVATARLLNVEILTPDRLITQYPGVAARW